MCKQTLSVENMCWLNDQVFKILLLQFAEEIGGRIGPCTSIWCLNHTAPPPVSEAQQALFKQIWIVTTAGQTV